MNANRCVYHKLPKPCCKCFEELRREREWEKQQRREAQEYHKNAVKDNAFDIFGKNLDSSDIFSQTRRF